VTVYRYIYIYLFIWFIVKDALVNFILIISNNSMQWLVKLCPNFINYIWIFLKVQRKGTEHLYGDGRCAVRWTVRSETAGCATQLSVSERRANVEEKSDCCRFRAKKINYSSPRIRLNVHIIIYIYIFVYLYTHTHTYIHTRYNVSVNIMGQTQKWKTV